MSLATVMGSAALFALVACRIAGFVVASPFPGEGVGVTQRVGLVVVLSWVSSAFAIDTHHLPDFGLLLAGQAAIELGFGIVIGLAFRFVFAAAEVLGSMLGLATGLGSASIFNPGLNSQETPVGRAITLLAMLVALGVGAHRVAIGALLHTFRSMPVGGGVALDAPLMAFGDLAIDAFVVGVRLSLPIVAVALIVHVALAMISRAAPSLQIFSVGLGVVIASTTLTLVTCLDDVTAGLSSHMASLAPTIEGVLGAMRP